MSRMSIAATGIMMILVCGMSLCPVPPSAANGVCDVYVDATFYGNPDGSKDAPFPCIYQALDNASQNCTIRIKPGEYYESITIDTPDLSLKGADPDEDPIETVIHGTVQCSGVKGCMLEGLTISDAQQDGVRCMEADVTIRRCIIIRNGYDGVHIDGGSALIEHCIVWNNGHMGIYAERAYPGIFNSIVTANRKGGVRGAEARFSIIQDHTQLNPLDGFGLINADPLFINADQKKDPPFDFRLKSRAGEFDEDSPAIDRGSSDGVSHDLVTDIGVYQDFERTEPVISPQRMLLEEAGEGRFSAFGGTPPYSWQSSDPEVASIDPNGSVVALRPGYTWIKAADSGAVEGNPALLVVKSPGDVLFSSDDPDSADLNTAHEAYVGSEDHLGMALTGLARCLDQPDPLVRGGLDGLGVTYKGIFTLDDPNTTSGPRTCRDLDPNAPGLDVIQGAVHAGIIPCIEESLGHLDAISGPDYRRFIGLGGDRLLEDANTPVDRIVEVDGTDVSFLKAGLHITHAVLDVVGAYTLWDPNLDYCIFDDPFRDDEGEPLANGVNEFLDAHPLILTLLDSAGQTRMASALTHLQAAVALVEGGFSALAAEDDDQEDDLVPKDLLVFDEDDEPYWDLDDVKRSLDPVTLPAVAYLDRVGNTPCTPLSVDLSRFFLNPLDRGSLPQYDAENDPDLDSIPDPTFGGILPGMDLARLNGLLLRGVDMEGGYQEYDTNCTNEIYWTVDMANGGDLESMTIYRSEEPCVDPETAQAVGTIGPFDGQAEFALDGQGYDMHIPFAFRDETVGDCSREGTYFYQVVASYTDPVAAVRSRILPVRNRVFCSGDIDGYNGITPKDALCAFQKYLEISPTSCEIPAEDVCCDVNGDFVCSPRDALCIFEYFLGLPSCLDYLQDGYNEYPSLVDGRLY
ncbi:MAG: right-handed parallel beta-helix repeat-containing protein [bacterium]